MAMTEKDALRISLQAAYRRWVAVAQSTDYKTGPMVWPVLSPDEMKAVRICWPKIKGVQGNSILPSVLSHTIRTLEQKTGTISDE